MLHQLTCPTSARFRARAPGPVSGRLYGTASGGAGHPVPLSRRLSAAGIRFLGILSRQRDSAPLTIGLPRWAAWTLAGFPCSARMRHGWGRVPSLPRGRRCLHGHGVPPDRRLPPYNGRSLSPRCHDPSRDVFNNGASARVHWHSPLPAFPSPVAPGRNEDPRAFPRAPHPAEQDPAAHAGAGTSLGTARSHVVSITDLLRRAHSPRAASCRTTP